MSQASSHPILLRLFLDHFKDFKDHGHHDELDRLRSGCLRNLSGLKSSTFHTNWLLEDLSIIGKPRMSSMEDLDTPTKFPTSPCGKTWSIIPTWMKPIVLIQPPKESQAFTLQEDGEPLLLPWFSKGGERNISSSHPTPYPTSSKPLAGTPCPQGEAEEMASPPYTCAHALCEAPGRGPDSTTLPLWAVGPWDEQGNETYQYWPFATDDLHNWKNQNPLFSDNPKGLINLLESVFLLTSRLGMTANSYCRLCLQQRKKK